MQRPKHNDVWIAASCASAALIVFAIGRLSSPASSRTQAVESTLAPPAAESPRADATVREPAPAPAVTAAVPRTGSVRELLERHYGLPWNEIRGLLADPDADPERMAELMPWEQAAPHIRASVLFRDEHSGDVELARALRLEGVSDKPNFNGALLNPGRKQLSTLDLQNLEHIDSECVSHLHDVVSEINALIPKCMADQFDRGDYVRVPLLETLEARNQKRDEQSSIRYLSSTHGGGWTVYFNFESRAYPELEALAQESKRLKLQRIERLREYIAAL